MLRSAFSRFFQPARRRRQQTPAFGFDALESRQLLAGTATVALSNNYDLSITGDARGNDVTVQVTDSGDVLMVGNDTVLKFRGFGQSMNVNPGTQVSLHALLRTAGITPPAQLSLRSITADMGRGDDTIDLTVNDDVTVARDVTFRMGTGSDSLILNANARLTIGGSLSVTGTGADNHHATVVINSTSIGNSPGIAIAKNLSVSVGSGHDKVLLGNADNLRQALEDPTQIDDDSTDPNSFAISVGGSFSVSTSLGNDLVAVSGVGVKGNVSVAMGSGGRRNDVLFLDNIGTLGSLTLTYMENGVFQNLSIAKNLTVTSSAHGDALAADHVQVGGNATMNLGAGSDRVAIGADVTVAGRVTVSGGAGRDFVSIAAPPAGARISGVEANELDIDLVEAMLEFLADSGLADSVMDLIPAAQPPADDADIVELIDAEPFFFGGGDTLVVAGRYLNRSRFNGRIGFYISEDAEITTDDVLIGSDYMLATPKPEWARNIGFQITTQVSRIPAALFESAEGYYIGVIADYTGATGDTQLENNGGLRPGKDLFYYVGKNRQEFPGSEK
ncbi:MAG: hypothetical protein ACK5YO_21750 [Planctomyces sp.]